MAISTLTPPRRFPPKTAPSKTKIRAMCNAIDQYFEYHHNQCPDKLARFRIIDGMEPKPKGRLGGWGTYERLQLAAETMAYFGEKEEDDFWVQELTRKFSDGGEDDEDDEEEEEEDESESESDESEGSDNEEDEQESSWVEDNGKEDEEEKDGGKNNEGKSA